MEEQEQKMSNGVNKTIITIVVVAVVILGGYFLFKGTSQTTPSVSQPSNQQTAPEGSLKEETSESPASQESENKAISQPSVSQPPATNENIVTYTDTGYSPSTLTVKKGEIVAFKNQSPQSMWTASAFHPTHTLYPTTGGCLGSTFDACQGVQPGNSWSFRFDFAGTWKYHNHLSPDDTGAIMVE